VFSNSFLCFFFIRVFAKHDAVSGNPYQRTLLTIARHWPKLKRHFRNDLL